MNIVFRCDSSLQIGTGHVMRCLTLANALSLEGHECTFICKAHAGNIIEKIIQKGHYVHALEVDKDFDARTGESDHHLAHSYWLGSSQALDATQCQQLLSNHTIDWLIVDNYALDYEWEGILRGFTKQIMVIDDLADRAHNCDLLLDQNLGTQDADYISLTPNHCKLLTGAKYALLRPEFAQWRDYSLHRRQIAPKLKTLLINLGGVDKDNVTTQILKGLVEIALPKDCTIQVVMGATAPHIDSVRSVASELPWQTEIIVNADNMAELMADADLAIGASGSTTWERCCLGLPSIQLVTADNQTKIANYLKAQKVAFVIHRDSIRSQLTQIIKTLVENPKHLSEVSYKCSTITDGLGTEKVRKLLTE